MKRAAPPLWPLDDLARRAEAALARDRVGQTNGQVREIPDPRTIRYYTTLGLLDRPAGFRGRTALYGPRHLRQLVAVKRFQARGLRLAEIQGRLVGLADGDLARIARVPADLEKGPGARRESEEAPPVDDAALAPPAPASPRPGRRAFWRQEPSAAVKETEGSPGGREDGGPDAAVRGGSAQAAEAAVRRAPTRGGAGLRLIELAPGLHLLLEVAREPLDEDIAALREAARPLAAEVARRGLPRRT